MSREVMTMDRFLEIKRQLSVGISVSQICRNLNCSDRTVRQIRDGKFISPEIQKEISYPEWAERADWDLILREVLEGHLYKFIWEERFSKDVGYKAFLDQFHKKYPTYKMTTTVHRYFAPGERCEVDYAGDKIEWINLETGELQEAAVFIGALGFSQKIFAEATADQKSRNFLESHTRMFTSFGGVPQATVPDCLKQGVSRTHLYDPNINFAYQALASDFNTVIMPARPYHPKDKSIAELSVKLVMRLYFWRFRKTSTPSSLKEICSRLMEVSQIINDKPHTRFKVSRNHAWQSQELAALQALPQGSYEYAEFKEATIHSDCYISVDASFYSCPKEYRGNKVQVKLTETQVEVFYDLQRIALHRRCRRRLGERITELSHLPDNAVAYLEMTPQNILSQARFLNIELHNLIDELFKESTIAHLRRAQGLVRKSRSEIKLIGQEKAKINIIKAIEHMKMFNKIRVAYFEEQLANLRKQLPVQSTTILRKPNPNLRHTGGAQLDLIVNNKTLGGEINGTSTN